MPGSGGAVVLREEVGEDGVLEIPLLDGEYLIYGEDPVSGREGAAWCVLGRTDTVANIDWSIQTPGGDYLEVLVQAPAGTDYRELSITARQEFTDSLGRSIPLSQDAVVRADGPTLLDEVIQGPISLTVNMNGQPTWTQEASVPMGRPLLLRLDAVAEVRVAARFAENSLSLPVDD